MLLPLKLKMIAQHPLIGLLIVTAGKAGRGHRSRIWGKWSGCFVKGGTKFISNWSFKMKMNWIRQGERWTRLGNRGEPSGEEAQKSQVLRDISD